MTVQQSNVQAQGLPSYRFQGLRGQALADETGKPLVGVSVFAWWGPDGVPDPLPKVARVAEAETRTDGKFGRHGKRRFPFRSAQRFPD